MCSTPGLDTPHSRIPVEPAGTNTCCGRGRNLTGYEVSEPGTRNTGREVVEIVGEGRDILSEQEVVIDNKDIRLVPT